MFALRVSSLGMGARPGAIDDAARFTRSTLGIATAPVGLGRPERVRKIFGVAQAPPAERQAYPRLYP